jgi:hypothetical protein
MNSSESKDEYQKQLESDLISRYGVVISGDALFKLLGFPSKAAFRQGIVKGQIHVPIFSLENRRGKHALAKDIAEWLTTIRFNALEGGDMN